MVLSDSKTYSEHWDAESEQYARTGIYKRLSEITPNENVLEIGSGNGHATLMLSSSREMLINGPTADVSGEMTSNFPDNESNRRSFRCSWLVNEPPCSHFSRA